MIGGGHLTRKISTLTTYITYVRKFIEVFVGRSDSLPTSLPQEAETGKGWLTISFAATELTDRALVSGRKSVE